MMQHTAHDFEAAVMAFRNPLTGEDGWDVEIRHAIEGPSHQTPDIRDGASLYEWMTYHGLMDDARLAYQAHEDRG